MPPDSRINFPRSHRGQRCGLLISEPPPIQMPTLVPAFGDRPALTRTLRTASTQSHTRPAPTPPHRAGPQFSFFSWSAISVLFFPSFRAGKKRATTEVAESTEALGFEPLRHWQANRNGSCNVCFSRALRAPAATIALPYFATTNGDISRRRWMMGGMCSMT